MLIGAHVSASGGVSKAVKRAQDIGAECFQIFAASPRSWSSKPIEEKEADAFIRLSDETGMGPAAIHAKYLVALGTDNEELFERSVNALSQDMITANRLKALGVIFHPASHRGRGFDAVFDQFVQAIRKILDNAADGDALLMLETSAGSGDHIGSKFEELAKIVDVVDNERVAVCLDTQHVWAAGYDISRPETLKDVVKEFDDVIGLEKLRAIHANDSKKPLGSAVDRHENIGDGEIGREGFLNFMRQEAFNSLPFYLEVSVLEDKVPDKTNVSRLKSIQEETRT